MRSEEGISRSFTVCIPRRDERENHAESFLAEVSLRLNLQLPSSCSDLGRRRSAATQIVHLVPSEPFQRESQQGKHNGKLNLTIRQGGDRILG